MPMVFGLKDVDEGVNPVQQDDVGGSNALPFAAPQNDEAVRAPELHAADGRLPILSVVPQAATVVATAAQALPAGDGKGPSLEQALTEAGVKKSHIRAAIQRSEMTGESLTAIMRGSDYGFLSPEKIAQVNAHMEGIEYFAPSDIDNLDPVKILKHAKLSKFEGFVPVAFDETERVFTIAISELRDVNKAQHAFGNYGIRWKIASERVIQAIYRRFFAHTDRQFDEAYKALKEVDPESESSSSLLRDLLLCLIRHACYMGASDIGIHPMKMETGGIVRLKVNGTGEIFRFLEWPVYQRIVNSFINESGKGEAIRLEPQEGKFEFREEEFERYSDISNRYAFRVELIKTVDTKDTAFTSIVIRILDQQADVTDFDRLGFDRTTEEKIRQFLGMQNGLILVTGPTGSGKTTTLYAALGEIDPIERWVQSIENPIEYGKGTWMQYQVPKAKGEAEGAKKLLKGLLRNAPDVVLMGEVRDGEVANVLVELANTGHLVFATLHNNNAALALTRLKNFGCDMPGVASVLLCILAQRLIKTLCPKCRVPDESADTQREMQAPWLQALDPKPFKAGEGCPACDWKGYRRRRMIYELLDVTPEIRTMIEEGRPPSEISRRGIDDKASLRANALKLVAQGITSMEEVYKLERR